MTPPLPPDLSKPAFSFFPEAADRVLQNGCVTCPNDIHDKDFTDELSRQEYSISGMCQTCQDSIFKEPEGDESQDKFFQESS